MSNLLNLSKKISIYFFEIYILPIFTYFSNYKFLHIDDKVGILVENVADKKEN